MKIKTNVDPGKKKKNPLDAKPQKYADFRRSDKHGRNTDAVAKSATGQFNSGAAPRVGGDVQKSTSLYTGKGAAAGAKKLKKAPTSNVSASRKIRVNKKKFS